MAEAVIRGGLKIKGSLPSGAGDDLLTIDSSTKDVGQVTGITALTDSHILVGDASNVPTDVAVTGDISISNTGVVAITAGAIVNADVNASAAIAVSKLAAVTASRLLVSDGSGFISASATTSTEAGYLSGVTSAIQTQIDSKQATITGAATTITSANLTTNRALISNGSGKVAISSVTDTELGYVSGVTSAIQTQIDTKLTTNLTSVAEGDIVYFNGIEWVNLARGTNGQALYSTASGIQWDTPTINGIPVGGTDGQVLAKQSGTDFDADWESLTVASITDLTATAAELNILDGATITFAELNYLSGVSSSIQTQLDGKLSTTLPQNSIFIGNSSNIATALPGGTNGYVLTSVGGVPTWAAISAGSPPGSDTQVIFNDGGSFGTDAGFEYDKTTNTLTVTNLETASTIGGAYIYRAGGTDIALADGGTGASLADPGADRILFWDDSAGQTTWLALSNGLSISTTDLELGGTLTKNTTISGADTHNFVIEGINTMTLQTTVGSFNITSANNLNLTASGASVQVNAAGFVLIQAPENDNALTQILVRDGSTGLVKYRSVSSLSGDFWPLSGTFPGAAEIDADGNTVQINNTGGFTLQSNAPNVIRSDDNPSYVFSTDTDTGEESGLDVGHNYGARLYYTPDALTTERLVEVNSSSVDVINRTSSGKVFKITTEDPGNWDISSTYYHAYAETTDATPTILFSFETESGKSYFIEGVVVARRTGGTGGSAGDSFASNFRVVVKNISGTASLVSGGGIIGTIQDNTMDPWNLNPITSGNEFRLTVTGIADNNITWRLGECKVVESF